MFSEQKLPVSTPPEQIWTLRYREQCTKWAGLSTQTAISTESAHQNDLTRCAVYTQYVILRSPRIVPVTNLNEAVPRTFHSARNMNACVPRTCSENILPGFCTENIYERALILLNAIWIPFLSLECIICCYVRQVPASLDSFMGTFVEYASNLKTINHSFCKWLLSLLVFNFIHTLLPRRNYTHQHPHFSSVRKLYPGNFNDTTLIIHTSKMLYHH